MRGVTWSMDRFDTCTASTRTDPPTIYIHLRTGVHECLLRSIMKADLDLRKTLFQQIVLAGGSTMFPGFGDRLLNEVRKLAPRDVKIRISAPPERKYSTWIGGCVRTYMDLSGPGPSPSPSPAFVSINEFNTRIYCIRIHNPGRSWPRWPRSSRCGSRGRSTRSTALTSSRSACCEREDGQQ